MRDSPDSKDSNNFKLPKISVVMPCYNCVDYIERSIRSVVEQDYPYIELFVKDGGSKDGSLDIIKYYAKKYPKVVSWISEPDKGQTDAVNIGMKKVTGEILGYLNADDVYKKGSLKIVGQYFSKNTNVMWAYGMCDMINGDDLEIRKWITIYKNFWTKPYSYNTLLILNYISQMACFWRKDAAKEIGQLDPKQNYVMDYEYWLRLGKKYRAGVIKQYLASFRIVPKTKSSTGFLQQFKDEYEVARKHTNNNFLLSLHKIHVVGIISIYGFLKFINHLKNPGRNSPDGSI